MRGPLTIDAVERLDIEGADHTDETHLRLAEHLWSLAHDPHPDDEMTPADLMVHAGECFSMAGEKQRAVEAYRAAVDTGDATDIDPRCFLFTGLMETGARDEALELAASVRRSHPTDPRVFLYMGQQWEQLEDRTQANAWYTRGMLLAEQTAFERDDGSTKAEFALLSMARWRLRESLGFAPDEYDELAIAVQEGLAEQNPYEDEDDISTDDDTWDDMDDPYDEWSPPVSRKAPCPCGSGRKYKHCCGRGEHPRPATPSHAVVSREAKNAVIDLF